MNGQGNSATVDLPSGSNPSLPPKPSTMSTPSADASKKPAAVTSSVSSTPISSGSGGYSLYSLIKKQSQKTPAATEKPFVSNVKVSIASPAKSTVSSLPVGLPKKPSPAASLAAEKHRGDSAIQTSSRNAVSFAKPVEKSTRADGTDDIHPQRFELFFSIHQGVNVFSWLLVGLFLRLLTRTLENCGC